MEIIKLNKQQKRLVWIALNNMQDYGMKSLAQLIEKTGTNPWSLSLVQDCIQQTEQEYTMINEIKALLDTPETEEIEETEEDDILQTNDSIEVEDEVMDIIEGKKKFTINKEICKQFGIHRSKPTIINVALTEIYKQSPINHELLSQIVSEVVDRDYEDVRHLLRKSISDLEKKKAIDVSNTKPRIYYKKGESTNDLLKNTTKVSWMG